MPHQNRVTPDSQLIATPARGTLTGNRGCLHNERGEIRRPFVGKRWIACLLEFRGRRRAVMTPGFYTELFFLDEVTALAAGHRPCAECRREEYNRFAGRGWSRGCPARERSPARMRWMHACTPNDWILQAAKPPIQRYWPIFPRGSLSLGMEPISPSCSTAACSGRGHPAVIAPRSPQSRMHRFDFSPRRRLRLFWPRGMRRWLRRRFTIPA